ncbi:Type IV fimbrial biogenesis protein PilV [Lysobacter dokdonensis DS-58]|uniref:Type IV fimbrial biogenesis protein PilV n=1 Tax=Lysobacter dokdonensis DS-58 TaxID=1300345 RepID=A0A0A2WK46_9GAMM|nr:prepilin-type N-terminal cleavage/methylation domain-containing protein [Lysobacter dokdonensis]KGQ18625.1 Type IV fimbrial biogenesis protein PilV [Lysobacter dokdonensis DS-58]
MPRRPFGFSLLEVLIAVALLATGLLAIAALQGALARGTADAKARSRVLALVSGELDALRATPFADIASLAAPIDARDPTCAAPANEAEHAACDSGIRGLRLHRTVASAGGGASKSVRVAAEWTAPTGETRTLELRTVLGGLALDPNRIRAFAHMPLHPQVRSTAAAITTADALPIAVGEGRMQVTTAPRIDALGTRFDIVTYTPDDDAGARIGDRIEMEVIKCRCRYDAGGAHLGPVHRVPQWPAIWTGVRYGLYAPEGDTPPPGAAYTAGPDPDVVQSPRCRECCRDRHDVAGPSPHAEFDPANADPRYRKYDLDEGGALVQVDDTVSGTYVDSCRLVRVDGWWRTAADLQARHFALLQTEAIDGVPAASRKPDPEAAHRYTRFVRDYLAQYADVPAPDNARALHDEPARGLNLPARITIATPPPTDRRHLHARALYVDALEPIARKALDDAVDARRANDGCAAGSAHLADCVLPYLPFFTQDLTDIAAWSVRDADVLAVDSHDPAADVPVPGGRVRGLAHGATDAVAVARLSNSGAASSTHIPGATDLQGDQATLEDTQMFEIRESDAAHVDAAPRRRPEYAPPPE